MIAEVMTLPSRDHSTLHSWRFNNCRVTDLEPRRVNIYLQLAATRQSRALEIEGNAHDDRDTGDLFQVGQHFEDAFCESGDAAAADATAINRRVTHVHLTEVGAI
jgi:hypothetical protein